jgi:hypothetical protein
MKSKEHQKRWANIFETLSSITRRELLTALLENPPDEVVGLPEAANSPELRRDPEKLVSDLTHCHLPKLTECGFIEWQKEPFCAERGPRFDEVAGVLEAIQSSEQIPEHLVEGCYYLQENEAGS